MIRKLSIAIGVGGLFVMMILGLMYANGFVEQLGSGTEKKKSSYAAPTDEIVLDSDYMDFYDLEDFETDLPVLFVNSQGNIITDIEPVMTKVSIINMDNDGSYHSIHEDPDVSFYASMNIRGASSKDFDKSQYKLVFYKDPYGNKKLDYDLLGMGAAANWVLNGPYLDKTLARNYLCYRLSGEIMDWAPECRYIELFVDGAYKGVYLVIEPVSEEMGRLNLSDYALLSGKTAYIISRDREGSDLNPLANYGEIMGHTSNDLYVDYPGPKSITNVEFDWITEDVSAFEMALYSDDYGDEKYGYGAHIDVDNFVDYFILNEVVMNHDAGNLSTFAYKEIGGKLKMAVWDFNNCYDNYQWFAEEFDEFYTVETAWFNRLVTDRRFVDRVVERYYELRKEQLSEENMFGILDESQEILGDAIDRNYKVWGFTFHKNFLTGKNRDLTSFEDADAQLRYSIIKRFNFLDKHITDLYEYCEN